jgi:hypothetical protein
MTNKQNISMLQTLDIGRYLQWDEAKGHPVLNRAFTPPGREIIKPKVSAPLKKFGDWSKPKTIVEHTFISTALGWLAFTAVAAFHDIVHHVQGMSQFAAVAMVLGVTIGALAVPVWTICKEYILFFRERKQSKEASYPFYQAYVQRTHGNDDALPYKSFCVDIQDIDGYPHYQLVQVDPGLKASRIILQTQAPQDIAQAAELGVELAQLAKTLEQEAQDKHQAAKRLEDARKQQQQLKAQQEERDKQTLREVMKQAVTDA